jgi:hypothetical protein
VTGSSTNFNGSGQVQLLFNWANNQYLACYMRYDRGSNLIYLMSDDGTDWRGGATPGTAAANLSNSQCTVNVQNSSALAAGTSLSATFAVTFQASFFGPQQIYAIAYDASDQDSGWWHGQGTWTPSAAPSTQPLCSTSSPCSVVMPAPGAGMGATFTFTSSDANGAGYIPMETISLGSNSVSGCKLMIYHYYGGAYLLDDTGSIWKPIPSTGTVSNSQCTINGGGTGGSDAGNNWNYNVSVTFANSYLGVLPLTLSVQDHAGASASPQVGTWTVVQPVPITVSTNFPGLSIMVDGLAYTSPQIFTWTPGSQHALAINSPQTGASGPMYVFSGWSDSSTSASRTITVPSAAAVYTANFTAIDFTITAAPTANPAIAMAGGNPATYTVTIGAVNGFSGAVALTASLPSGFYAVFGSNSITGAGSTTLTVYAPAGSAGNIPVSVTGASGPLNHTASGGTLAVQDFTATLSPAYPSPVTLGPNTQGNWTVVTSGLNGFTGTVDTRYYNGPFSGSSLPTCSNLQFVGMTSPTTFTLTTGIAPQQQWCSFELLATANGTTHTMVGYLIEQQTGDFILSQPSAQTVVAGSGASFQAAYTPINGFAGSVGFNVTGLPAGVNWGTSLLAAPLQGDSIAVSVPSNVPGGTYPVTITATSGSIVHNVVTQLIVQAGADFTMSVSPSVKTIQQGGSATFTVSLTPSAGFSGAATLTIGPITGGVSVSPTSAVVSASSPATLTFTAASNATLGAYRITINGASGSLNHYAIAPLLVTLGPVAGQTIALGSIPVQANGQTTGQATMVPSPLQGSEQVSTCTPPPGVSVVVASLQGSQWGQTLSITASPQVQPGTTATLSCTTSASRTLTALLQYGGQLPVLLTTTAQGNGYWTLEIDTYGFTSIEEVDWGEGPPPFINVPVPGDIHQTSPQFYIPPEDCDYINVQVWGSGGESGAAYGWASTNVCNRGQGPTVSLNQSPISMGAGGQASITATGSQNVTYSWKIIQTQTGDNTAIATFAQAPSCNSQPTCTAVLQGSATGGKATVQVTATDVTGQQAVDTSRLIVVQFTSVNVVATNSLDAPTNPKPPISSDPASTFPVPTGALLWPPNLWTPGTPLVMIRDLPCVRITATTVPPASDPDVAIRFAVFRATDDAPSIGGEGDLPHWDTNSTGQPGCGPPPSGRNTGSLTLNQTGSFQVLAYVDTNSNQQRDNTETGAAVPIVLVQPTVVSNTCDLFPRNIHQVLAADDVGVPGVWISTAATGANGFNVDLFQQSAVHFAATVNLLGGGRDGARGTGQVFGQWVQSNTGTDRAASYANGRSVIGILATNGSVATSAFGDHDMFIPGNPAPIYAYPPILDNGQTDPGTGGYSSGFKNSRITSVTANNPQLGVQLLIEAVDSPTWGVPNRLPPDYLGFETAIHLNSSYLSFLVMWTNTTGQNTQTPVSFNSPGGFGTGGKWADSVYGVILEQPWAFTAAYPGATPASAPGVPVVHNPIASAGATSVILLPPTFLSLLVFDARQ